MSLSFAVVVGNPRPASRTHRVAAAAAAAIAGAAGPGIEPETVDLAALAPRLFLPEPSAAVEDAVDLVARADLVLVVSPTYKGTYTGLLKAFLDRLPPLEGALALPLLVMGSPRHALAVEVHLRPLLVELGATVPTPGLALLESDLDRLDEVVGEWADRLGPALRSAPYRDGVSR